MEVWSRLPRTHPNVDLLVVAQKPFALEKSACEHGSVQAQRLLDGHGVAARAFNAAWLPRAYVLDEAGRVIYRQPEATMNEQAPTEAENAVAQTGSRYASISSR